MIQLYPGPDTSLTYHADVELLVEPLVSPFDEPILIDDYHWILSSYAMYREYIKRKDLDLIREERARFNDGKADHKLAVSKIGGIGTRGRPRRFSQLGPYFQPGT